MTTPEEAKQLIEQLDAKILELKSLEAVKVISGRSDASVPEPVKDPDAELVAYINSKLSGTGLKI